MNDRVPPEGLRGQLIAKEPRGTPWRCAHIPGVLSHPALSSGSCPSIPTSCPPVHRYRDRTVSLQGFKLSGVTADCPVSGTLKWLPPFLGSQAFLHAGMTRPHVLPWGSHQSLDRKVIHRCQPIMELQLPPRTPSFPLPPLPLSSSSFHSPLPPLTYWYCHLLT